MKHAALLFLWLFIPLTTWAATPKEPPLPEPIERLKADGATLRYLGRDLGFDGWIAVQDGQEQYFYVTPDGSTFFLGVMFNKNGRVVTFDQMRRLQGEKDPIFDDLLNAPTTATAPTTTASTAPATPATPAAAPSTLSKSEQLWNDVQQAASFPLGAATAPPMYVFIDPACPHCKELVQKMIPAVDAGQIRLMVLLVGALAPESAGWAAGLLANANPGQALRTMVETNTAPTSADANDIRLKNNHNLMKKWRFDGTPVSVYRAQDGRIKLLTGAPKSADIILNDLR